MRRIPVDHRALRAAVVLAAFGLSVAATLAPTAAATSTTRAEPPLTATPRATCGPGSRPEPGLQGRIPPGPGSARGFTCNITQLGHEGTAGGFKVERYVDTAGHECAYYDTTLTFASNAASATLDGKPTGTAVLDMSNPAKPVRTATLMTPAMQSPHESLLVNQKRGLLAAVLGNLAFGPGVVDLYDVSEDCRHPVLQSSLPVGVFGHESGFTLDGKTFYATSLDTGKVTAVDVTNPKLPVTLWVGRYTSHGMSLSDDGNRAYLAALNGLVILDTSEIQARKPNPQESVVSTLRWSVMTIPQNAMPVTIGGKPYLVEVDEFSADASTPPGPFGVASNGKRVGGARMIDISNEKAPRVISNMRLEVNQPENRAAIAGDPGAASPAQGYASHYCGVPQEVDPGHRRVLVHRLGPARVRHPRSLPPEGDRLLRRATDQRPGFADGEERLCDVAAVVRARARRDLVLGRQQRLLLPEGVKGRLAVRLGVRLARRAAARLRDPRDAAQLTPRRLGPGAGVRALRRRVEGQVACRQGDRLDRPRHARALSLPHCSRPLHGAALVPAPGQAEGSRDRELELLATDFPASRPLSRLRAGHRRLRSRRGTAQAPERPLRRALTAAPVYHEDASNLMMPPSATTPKTSTAIDAFVRLVRANAAVTRQLSAQLSADHGLNISAYEALLRLTKAPDSRLRRVDLANGLLLTAGGVTRLLDGLERDGFVVREECASDRRVTYAVLTEAGRAKLREASKSHTRQIRELVGGPYDEDELAQLVALLDRLPGVDPTGDSCE